MSVPNSGVGVQLRPNLKEGLDALKGHLTADSGRPISQILPLLFSLRGRPYSLGWSHFLMEPMFKLKNIPRLMILKSGRQVGKSQSQSASLLLRALATPYYNSLTVMPLFEQVRKFSHNYVRPFLTEGPLANTFLASNDSDSVLQRTLRNKSTLFFSYSSGDPSRVRGIAASETIVDECLCAGTLIDTPHSGSILVSNLKSGDVISAFDPSSGSVVTDKVIQVVAKGTRPVWRLRLIDGAFLDCTDNEKLWTTSGWVYVADYGDLALPVAAPLASESLIGRLVSDSGSRCFTVYRQPAGEGLLVCRATPRSAPADEERETLPAVYVLRRASQHGLEEASLEASEVIEVKYLGEEPVYDVETEKYHTLFANGIAVHNCQDMDLEDIPIIESCMGASPYKIMRLSGTPKTFDNPLQVYWEDSSQGIWHIKCDSCGYTNRCSADGDLLKMIKPKTLCCARCDAPVNSRAGFYVHDFPGRIAEFAGYHQPQPVLPLHYESETNWKILLDAMNPENKPTYVFYNEYLGESYDAGAKILTADELKDGCIAEAQEPDAFLYGQYIDCCVGVDWGGRGREKTTDSEDFISNTAIALAGLSPSGHIDVVWLHKVPYTVDPAHESEMVVNVSKQSHANFIAFDYGGQGNVQEQMLKARGWREDLLFPFTYNSMSPSRPIVFYTPPKKHGVRSSYTLDKARSILLLCELIKRKIVRLPNNPKYIDNHLKDFLNIYEEALDNPRGSPRRLVKRMSRRTDDVVHAINFAVMGLFHRSGAWPELAKMFIEPE